MSVYYNENDPKAAAWLRILIQEGVIPEGVVDERSIHDVKARELRSFTQCHFFAGIGGWAEALRLANWGNQPVWTGSCPCQPFSAAGKGLGQDDPRHLWPIWFELIRQCRPLVIFGEQVASRAALSWLDTVQDDLESEIYALGAVDLCAAGVGAPHIRQRLYWVADALRAGRPEWRPESGDRSTPRCAAPGFMADTKPQHDRSRIPREGGRIELANSGAVCTLAHPSHPITPRLGQHGRGSAGEERLQPGSGSGEFMGNTGSAGLEIGSRPENGPGAIRHEGQALTAPGAAGSAWADCEWLYCTDGKSRPVEPGSFPLAHGIPGRVGLLRGYGNAIIPEAAAEFVRAYKEITIGRRT